VVKVLQVDPANPDPATIALAAEQLRRGQLVAFPTETVYGLGANALIPGAVARVFTAKGRPATDPLIVHVTDLDAALPLVETVPASARRLAEQCWPGPLTLILPRTPLISDAITGGRPAVALRVPSHPVALALIRAAGVPVVAPSANLFSRPSPTRADHVLEDLGTHIDLLLDAGSTPIGVESTVVDLTSSPPVVLRPGGTSLERLRALLPHLVVRQVQTQEHEAAPAPGTLLRHYAPVTPLRLYEGEADAVLHGVVADARRHRDRGEVVLVLGPSTLVERARSLLAGEPFTRFLDLGGDDGASIALQLYDRLRTSDTLGVSRILAMQLENSDGLADAVRDRLRRASSGDVVICHEHPAAPRP